MDLDRISGDQFRNLPSFLRTLARNSFTITTVFNGGVSLIVNESFILTVGGLLLAVPLVPYQRVGHLLTQESGFFKQLKSSQPFFVMAGPNVIQSEEHVLKMARQIKAVTDKLGLQLIFKSSFDKANRTNAASFRGPGLEEGLRWASSFMVACMACYSLMACE